MRTIEEAMSELTREKNVRLRCYDRWVQEGRLTATDAKDRLDRINAALYYLDSIANPNSQVSGPMIAALPTTDSAVQQEAA